MRRNPVTVFAVLLAILLLAQPALVSEAGAEVKTFTQTVRQTFGGSQSPDDAKTAAIAKAKREALEKAGTFLETLQIIKDGRLSRDMVLTLASGVLKTEIVSTKTYATGEAFGIEVVARIRVDTSILEARIRQVLNDRSLIQKLEETRKQRAELLERVAALEVRNRELQTREKSRETGGTKTNLKQQFAALTAGLSAVELNQKALTFWRNGKYTDPDQAIKLLTEAIRLDPKYAMAYGNRGNAYMGKSQFDRAIQDYNVAIRLEPQLARAFRNRGNAYAEKGQYDQAIEDYDEAIRLNPRYAFAFGNRGIAYADKGQPDRAIQDYNEAIRLDPRYAAAFVNRGNAYIDKGQFDRAIQDYDEAIRLDPRSAIAFSNRGNAYNGKGQYDRAIQDYDEAIRLDPRSAVAFNNRGNTYKNKGQDDRAIQDYDEAIRLDPSDALAFNGRGTAYSDKGQFDRAIQDYNEAIRLNPRYAIAFSGRGLAYDGKRQYDRAIQDYNEAIRLDPRLAGAFNNRGNAYADKGQYDRAIQDYDEAIRLDPNGVEALNNKAWLLATAKERDIRDGAEAVRLAKLVYLLSNDNYYLDTLAAAHAETGDFPSAIREQVRAIKNLRDKNILNQIADHVKRLDLYRQNKPYRE